jgi:hypothetical protein
MSRLSNGRLQQMKTEILTDLYKTTQTRLADRAVEIAKNSRQHWISQYEPVLQQLPDELIAKTVSYIVAIKYPWGRTFTPTDLHTSHIPRFADGAWENLDYIQENWEFKSPKAIVNPITFNTYGNTAPEPQELHPNVHKDAETLCKEKIKLLKETARMQNYLDDLTNKNKTHKQLREVLPSSFHRYIPPETVRQKAVKKEARHVEVPDFLGERQTINLLEDN